MDLISAPSRFPQHHLTRYPPFDHCQQVGHPQGVYESMQHIYGIGHGISMIFSLHGPHGYYGSYHVPSMVLFRVRCIRTKKYDIVGTLFLG